MLPDRLSNLLGEPLRCNNCNMEIPKWVQGVTNIGETLYHASNSSEWRYSKQPDYHAAWTKHARQTI